MSAKKKYFIIDFMHLIHQAFQILSTFSNQRHYPHIHSQRLIFLTFIVRFHPLHCH